VSVIACIAFAALSVIIAAIHIAMREKPVQVAQATVMIGAAIMCQQRNLTASPAALRLNASAAIVFTAPAVRLQLTAAILIATAARVA